MPASNSSLMEALLAARLHNPFSYLGFHRELDSSLIRVFYPDAINVWVNIGEKGEAAQKLRIIRQSAAIECC